MLLLLLSRGAIAAATEDSHTSCVFADSAHRQGPCGTEAWLHRFVHAPQQSIGEPDLDSFEVATLLQRARLSEEDSQVPALHNVSKNILCRVGTFLDPRFEDLFNPHIPFSHNIPILEVRLPRVSLSDISRENGTVDTLALLEGSLRSMVPDLNLRAIHIVEMRPMGKSETWKQPDLLLCFAFGDEDVFRHFRLRYDPWARDPEDFPNTQDFSTTKTLKNSSLALAASRVQSALRGYHGQLAQGALGPALASATVKVRGAYSKFAVAAQLAQQLARRPLQIMTNYLAILLLILVAFTLLVG